MEAVFLQFIYQVGFQVNVYRPVPGECPTTLFVAAEAPPGSIWTSCKIPDEYVVPNAKKYRQCAVPPRPCGIDLRYFPGDAQTLKTSLMAHYTSAAISGKVG